MFCDWTSPYVKKHDFVWVIVDMLTKSAHFIPFKIDYSVDRLVELYVDEIVQLHGAPLSIMSDRDLDLHQDSGRSYSQHWVLVSILV